MQKGYLASNQFDSLLSIQQSANPANASVAENLSGTAQQLKSADSAVAYKNLNGSNIEDTTMVQDAHNQQIQTDWTDNYDAGVNSTVIQTSPSISQNINVTQLHSTTISSQTENINTIQDARTYTVTQWNQLIGTSQKSVPTNEQTTIVQNGTSTTGNLQSQIGTQNLNTSALNQNFGSLTQNGNTALAGTSNINGAKIQIGTTGNTSNLTAPVFKNQPIVYEFYIVNTDGIYYHLTDSLDFSDYIGDFNIGDFFEEEYWELLNENKETELSKAQMIKMGVLGGALSTIPIINAAVAKEVLKQKLEEYLPQFESQVPNAGGLLVMALYDVSEVEAGEEALLYITRQPGTAIDNSPFSIVGSGNDYNALIKKQMTGSMLLPTPINNMHHWEFLFIWVTKK